MIAVLRATCERRFQRAYVLNPGVDPVFLILALNQAYLYPVSPY